MYFGLIFENTYSNSLNINIMKKIFNIIIGFILLIIALVLIFILTVVNFFEVENKEGYFKVKNSSLSNLHKRMES